MELKVGDKVRVFDEHWLRGGEVGRIIFIDEEHTNPYVVEFPRKIIGRGLDGNKIYLGIKSLSLVTDAKR